MYIKIKNKKIQINEYSTKKEKFKSLKFIITPIDYGIKLKKQKLINTYFFCQNIDIIVTDKNNKIIALFNKVKSEKMKFIKNAYNIYYLPLDTVKYLNIEEQLKEYK